MRLRLAYFDQNDAFADLLPRDGTVEQQIKDRHDQTWSLFHPDLAIVHHNCTYPHLLLKSRWQGHDIGTGAETSVFIRLVPDGSFVGDRFNPAEFELVAWGMTAAL